MKDTTKAQPAGVGRRAADGSGGAADLDSAFDHPHYSTEAPLCQTKVICLLENRPTADTWWKEFVLERVWDKLTSDSVDMLIRDVYPRWPASGEFDKHTLILGADENLDDETIKRIDDFLEETRRLWPLDFWPVYHIQWEPWDREKSAPIEVRNSDQGNAIRLVRRHGQDLLYCHLWRKWLIWDGQRWRLDDTAEVVRRAKETVRSIYAEAEKTADENERKTLAKHALRSESEARLRAMIKRFFKLAPNCRKNLGKRFRRFNGSG